MPRSALGMNICGVEVPACPLIAVRVVGGHVFVMCYIL